MYVCMCVCTSSRIAAAVGAYLCRCTSREGLGICTVRSGELIFYMSALSQDLAIFHYRLLSTSSHVWRLLRRATRLQLHRTRTSSTAPTASCNCLPLAGFLSAASDFSSTTAKDRLLHASSWLGRHDMGREHQPIIPASVPSSHSSQSSCEVPIPPMTPCNSLRGKPGMKGRKVSTSTGIKQRRFNLPRCRSIPHSSKLCIARTV